MDIGLAELRACKDRYDRESSPMGFNRRNSSMFGGGPNPRGSMRRGSSSVHQRRVSHTLLYGGPTPGSPAAALASHELALWVGDELDDEEDDGRGSDLLESINLAQSPKSLFATLGLQHSNGSKKAQQRVTNNVMDARNRKAIEAEAIDAAIAERKQNELRLDRMMQQQRRDQKRHLRGGSAKGQQHRRMNRSSSVTPDATLTMVNWSLTDVPLIVRN